MEPRLMSNNQPLDGSVFQKGDIIEFKLFGSHVFELFIDGEMIARKDFSGTCRVYPRDLINSGTYTYRVGGFSGTIKIVDPLF